MNRLKLNLTSRSAAINPKGKMLMELIFITGGAGQGKRTYAGKHYPDWQVIINYEDIIWQEMEAGKDPVESVKKMLACSGRLVITMSETGAGLVPVDKRERRFRDLAGMTGCYLAEQAKEVYRMFAGIEVKLKG